jgi:hypothetical protein
MLVRILSVIAFLALIGSSATAQSDAFQRQLSEGDAFRDGGNLERAREVYQDLSRRPGLTPEEKAIALFRELETQRRQAWAQRQTAAVVAALTRTADAFDAVAGDLPDAAAEAQLRAASVRQEIAGIHGRQFERSRAAADRQAALEMFAAVANDCRGVRNAVESVDDLALIAWSMELDAGMERIFLLDRSNPGFANDVDASIEACIEFLWSWSGYLAEYSVNLHLARLYHLRAEVDEGRRAASIVEAEKWFAAAWKLSALDKKIDPGFVPLLVECAVHRARFQRQVAEWVREERNSRINEAELALEQAIRLLETQLSERQQATLSVEQAQFLMARGKMDEAKALFQALLEGPAQRTAAEQLDAIGSDDPEIQRLLAEMKYAQGRFADARARFEMILDSGKGFTVAEFAKLRYQLAMCYRRTGDLEAALKQFTFAERIIRDDREQRALAADAAFERIRVAQDLYFNAEDDVIADTRRITYEAALTHFMDTYYGDSRAGEVVYLRARAAQQQERFRDAADLFERVPEESKQYADAVYQAGYCHYRLAFAERRAVDAMDAPLKSLRAEDVAEMFRRASDQFDRFRACIESDLRPGGDDPDLNSRILLAQCHLNRSQLFESLAVEDPEFVERAGAEIERLLEAVRGFHEEFVDAFERRAVVDSLQIRAHVRAVELGHGDREAHLDAVAELADAMRRKWQDLPDLVEASLERAARIHHEAWISTAGDDLDSERRALYLSRAATFYYAWSELNTGITPHELEIVGDLLSQHAVAANDKAIAERALESYDQVFAALLRAEQGGTPVEEVDPVKLHLKRAGCLRQALRIEDARGVYEDNLLPAEPDNLAFQLQYTDLLMQHGSLLRALKRNRDAIRAWERVERIHGSIVMRLKPSEEPELFWSTLARYTDARFQLGEYEALLGYIREDIEFRYSRSGVPEAQRHYWDEIQERADACAERIR